MRPAKKAQLLLLATLIFFVLGNSAAKAVLIPMLDGQVVYDTVRNQTWLADANLAASERFGISEYEISSLGSMSWYTAFSWIDAMNAYEGGNGWLGFNDWRLPAVLQPDPSCDVQSDWGGDEGSWGNNCVGCDLGYMHHELLQAFPWNGYWTGNDEELAKFNNIQADERTGVMYLTSMEYEPDPNRIWAFDFYNGYQLRPDKLYPTGVPKQYYVWALRDGSVAPVPEPSTIVLLGPVLVVLAGFGRKKFRK